MRIHAKLFRACSFPIQLFIARLHLYNPSVSHYANYTSSPGNVRQLDQAKSVVQ